MLWLCLHLPRLPLSALGAETIDTVVVDQRGSQRWLITGTPDCEAGTLFPQASALYSQLRFKVRKPAAEQEALRSLAYWAYRYGQPVTAEIQDLAEPGRSPRTLLWVEIGRSLELFGGLEALRDQLYDELLELGYAAQTAIAPTRAGAALLACAGRSDPVFKPADLRARVSDLPLAVLHWPGEVLSALSGVGLRQLGELFAIPREAFVRRFGAEYRIMLDRLLGMASEPFEALVPPEVFRRRFELAAEIEEVERLQFPLKRLCTELQAYLRARDCGLRSVTLAVGHAGARETRIHAQFVDPHRDANRIFDALRERLERDGLPLPARELVLMAEDFAEAVVPQNDLFDPRAGQAQAWTAAIERIRARLGEAVGSQHGSAVGVGIPERDIESLAGKAKRLPCKPTRVWTPQAVEDYRPECGTFRTNQVAPATSAVIPKAIGAARPTFLLSEPWIMPPPSLPAGTAFERIESGWWDGRDVRRDYTTLDINGSRAWVFREVATQTWYLHGWWS